MKKSSLLTFLFAFIPGAGHMYLGAMKKGVSLMLAFSTLIAIMGLFNLGFLGVLLPVLWFYSFFDTFNLRNMPYEQRVLYEDKFLFDLDVMFEKDWMSLMKKRHKLTGGILVFLGLWIVFNNLISPFLWQLQEYLPWLYDLIRSIPTLLVAVTIICFGIYLLFGGRNKTALPPAAEDDYVEYGGKDK